MYIYIYIYICVYIYIYTRICIFQRSLSRPIDLSAIPLKLGYVHISFFGMPAEFGIIDVIRSNRRDSRKKVPPLFPPHSLFFLALSLSLSLAFFASSVLTTQNESGKYRCTRARVIRCIPSGIAI